MYLATLLLLSLACVGLCAADDNPSIACNIKAISVADRPRYIELTKLLRTAIQSRIELPDGYAYTPDTRKATLSQLGEWITMERLCCPFLDFQFDVKRDGVTRLTMRGPTGTKAVLREEFPEKR